MSASTKAWMPHGRPGRPSSGPPASTVRPFPSRLKINNWLRIHGLAIIFFSPVADSLRYLPLHIHNCMRCLAPTGLYFFNYFRTPVAWKQRVLGCMADPAALATADKRYELDHNDRKTAALSRFCCDKMPVSLTVVASLPDISRADPSGHCGAFMAATHVASLPVLLQDTLPGGGAELVVASRTTIPEP